MEEIGNRYRKNLFFSGYRSKVRRRMPLNTFRSIQKSCRRNISTVLEPIRSTAFAGTTSSQYIMVLCETKIARESTDGCSCRLVNKSWSRTRAYTLFRLPAAAMFVEKDRHVARAKEPSARESRRRDGTWRLAGGMNGTRAWRLLQTENDYEKVDKKIKINKITFFSAARSTE